LQNTLYHRAVACRPWIMRTARMMEALLKFADSLMHEFKTKNGRSVYDGSGIYPDIFVKQDRFASVTQTLVSKLLIFDYATKYRNTHPQIGDPRAFALKDAEYLDFTKFLTGKNYSYSTVSEKMLDQLKTEAALKKNNCQRYRWNMMH
jgi:carboxyl-terminal processing protease